MKPDFPRPPFPSESKVSLIADWAELTVLSNNGSLSQGRLQQTLTREGVKDVDTRLQDTWLELERREVLHGPNWPMKLKPNNLILSHHSDSVVIFYYFLCALSFGAGITNQARAMFEHCVADVISALTKQNALRLGFPRGPGVPASFPDALTLYTRLSREELVNRPLPDDKDLGLDIATWLRFSDNRGGYLHLVGQCATGEDWYSKLDDLKLHWWTEHIRWSVQPVRFFATPTVIPTDKWRRTCLAAGLVLDRPRLIELSVTSPLKPRRIATIVDYCRRLYS